jgi:hypothetical protein
VDPSGTITISSDAANSPAVISWSAPTLQGVSAAVSAVSAASAASAAASAAASSAVAAKSSIRKPSTPHSIDLTWSPSSSDGIVGYNVYRSSVSGGPYNPITSNPIASSVYIDHTVGPAQTFYYVVTALATGGQESGFSDEVAVATP